MNRRQLGGYGFGLALQMYVMSLAGPFIRQAQAQANVASLFRQARRIKELIDDVEEFQEWTRWSDEAARAVDRGRQPPPAPGIAGAPLDKFFSSRMAAQAAKVDAIEPLQFDTAIVVNPPRTASPEATRQDLKAAVSLLIDAISEVQDAAASLEEFKSVIAALGRQAEMLLAVSDLVIELALKPQTSIGGPLIVTELVTQGSALRAYSEGTTETENAARAKHESALKKISARKVEIDVQSNNLRNLLEVERLSFSGLNAEIRELERQLAIQQQQNREAAAKIGNAQEAMRTQRANLETVRRQIDELSRRPSIGQLSQRLGEVQNSLSQPYGLCPNRHRYDDCTHHQLKAQWDERTASLRRSQTSLQEQLRVVRAGQAEQQAQLSDLSARRLDLEQRMREAQDAIVENQNLLARGQEPATRLENRLKAKRESGRTDIFEQENRYDIDVLDKLRANLARL